MFPVPVEVWGSAPPASQLRLKEARREHLLRSHGISRYSDIIQQDLYRWREMNNSPKFSSLPSALEEEEREREMQKVLQSRRRVASGGNGTKAKLKDIWKKILPSLIGKSSSKSRDKYPSESDIQGDSSSGSSGSPSLRGEPEKSILNRDRSNSAPKKVVRWADESDLGKSPRTLNLSTIDEEGALLHRQVGDLAFETEPDEPFFELDDEDARLETEQLEQHIIRHPDMWPPHPGLLCANSLNSYSDSELTRHAASGCSCCDEREAVLASLRSPDAVIRSPDAGFHSPESASSSRTAGECAAAALALSAAAASLPSSSGASSLTNPASSDSPSSFLPVKLPRLASTPSLLPSQLDLNGSIVVSRSGVRHHTVTLAAQARFAAPHPTATAHP